MPLTRIALRRGKPPEYRKAVTDSVYAAMRETFNVPEDDRFMLVSEHDETDFSYLTAATISGSSAMTTWSSSS